MGTEKFGEDLAVDVGEQNRIKTIRCSGHIDSNNYLRLSDVVDNLFKSGFFKIVVDLSEVKYISSAGWGIFLGNSKKAGTGGGGIRLAGMQEGVKDVFSLLELGNILQEYKTVEEASTFN